MMPDTTQRVLLVLATPPRHGQRTYADVIDEVFGAALICLEDIRSEHDADEMLDAARVNVLAARALAMESERAQRRTE